MLRMKNITITNRLSQAKVVGTIVTLAGATIMTLFKCPGLYGRVLEPIAIGEFSNVFDEGPHTALKF
jgi:hypothetical protein